MTTAGVTLPQGFDPLSPEIETEAVPQCPTCGGTDRQPFSSGYDYELETCRNEWHFWRCNACHTVWLDPRPAEATLATIYPPHYYAYALSETLSPLAVKGKAWLDSLKLRSVLTGLDAPPRSFLDIGCGDGRYLKLFADRGMPKERIYGLELSDEPVRKLREQGFQAYKRRVEDCTEIPDGSIDLATMFHVIEHVADPLRVTKRVAQWLSPGGVFALETPNLASWDARLFKEHWWGGYHFPRHWTLFEPASLSRLMKEAGLEIVSTSYQTGHSFWMYSLHHRLKYHAGRPQAARWFDPMRSLLMLTGFTGFDVMRRTLGAPTSAMLMIARKPKA